MEIRKAEYFKSVFDLKELPQDNFSQIAFAGRSNVGKSSLINTLTNQKNLAKISKTPGKTKALNFINLKYLVVLTKSDKLSSQGLSDNSQKFKEILENDNFVFFSAKTKAGGNKILSWIKHLL